MKLLRYLFQFLFLIFLVYAFCCVMSLFMAWVV